MSGLSIPVTLRVGMRRNWATPFLSGRTALTFVDAIGHIDLDAWRWILGELSGHALVMHKAPKLEAIRLLSISTCRCGEARHGDEGE
jgi:hypothetical protein